MARIPPADAARHFEEYCRTIAAVRESGHLLARNRLLPPGAATKVRVREGRISATDGPYAETKEQLGGCDMIEAEDPKEAARPGARIPGPWIGCVPVRPIAEDAEACRVRWRRAEVEDGEPADVTRYR